MPPRLLVLDYKPPGAKRTFALVGKGVVYDTGGLSLKATAGMSSMKGDMGGGAAVVGAFHALASTGFGQRVVAAVPLAENAIGPNSYRNDDIIVMHSKKTVEINNTDAEGAPAPGRRRELPGADLPSGPPHSMPRLSPAPSSSRVACATHRSSPTAPGVESLALDVGRSCGDLTHALLFAPEFYMSELESKVADMRNSVANRMNAQSSCAAQFVYAQIQDLDLPWLHIDLAGPAWRDGRGTGYGVALISQILRRTRPGDWRE